NDLQFPFKRYQIQPVWRADRPQKGRYREFYQCDADVVGSNSLLCEAELILMAHKILSQLGINQFEFKLNNRKVLSGIVEQIGEPGKESIICTAIDKLDKIGDEGVIKELTEKGISENSIKSLLPILKISGSNTDKLINLKNFLANSEIGLKGISELEQVLEYIQITNPTHKVVFDQALARGLSYYTGAIFEIKALNVQIGSISGGGRYDNLTGLFGLPDVSGVGISFGIDRIYDVMEELEKFPETSINSTKILIVVLDDASSDFALKTAENLRQNGIYTEVFPEIGGKMKKQLGYADGRKIPFAGIIGTDESEKELISLKNLITGEQKLYNSKELIDILQA
ncbi:MAG: histidine--tRNA ligase, partial [Opitutaceae bacterium]|nr:histidine--tRNA ligase [Cytophagales bacterium]